MEGLIATVAHVLLGPMYAIGDFHAGKPRLDLCILEPAKVVGGKPQTCKASKPKEQCSMHEDLIGAHRSTLGRNGCEQPIRIVPADRVHVSVDVSGGLGAVVNVIG